LVCDDGGIFLGWICNLLPAVQQCAGNLYGAMQMKHEPDDLEMFGDLILLIIAMFFFVLFVIGIGALVWWML
jgi:hypothetical protein